MINNEPLLSFFVAHDSLSILFITIVITIIFNLYLRDYLSLLFRTLPTWLFAYILSLTFVHLYSNWLRGKVDSYADFGGFMFSTMPDAPIKPHEFSIYWEALFHDTWRNIYFLTGVVVSLLVVIIVEVMVSMFIRIKKSRL